MMQQAWVQGLSWDEYLPEEHRRTWKQWFEELIKLSLINIPRCLRKSIEVGHIEIHTFSDASEKAYSTVVYIRHEYKDGGVSVRLVAAKTRLASLKTISISRFAFVVILHESSSREIPCRSWPRNGKENGKRMHNVQTAFYRQTRRSTNGTIAQYQIRVDDETFHELCS